MPRNWEETFRRWSGPSSNSEQEKQERAERMIREAIRQSRVLTGKQIEVFGQGSYRNNTNVREDSDVDICARCMDVCFAEFTETSGLTREAVGLVDAAYTYPQLNNDVEAALVA